MKELMMIAAMVLMSIGAFAQEAGQMYNTYRWLQDPPLNTDSKGKHNDRNDLDIHQKSQVFAHTVHKNACMTGIIYVPLHRISKRIVFINIKITLLNN